MACAHSTSASSPRTPTTSAATATGVRITAEGRLLLCLSQGLSADLRRSLREKPGDDARVKRAIMRAMSIKPHGHDFVLSEQSVLFRHMNATGG